MKCIFCNGVTSRVIDSRPADDGNAIRRRRECETCSRRFTTYEKIETMPLLVIKKDRSREPFDSEKIRSGIVKSCEKRPVSMQDINNLVREIEMRVFNLLEQEVPTQFIGEQVMEGLRNLDEVAYVRFASVYRSFKDIRTFKQEISRLLGEENNE